MNNSVILGGSADLAIGVNTIPAALLSDITPNFAEGTRSSDTLGGKRTQPSGIFDTSELKFTLYVPSIDYLKSIWSGLYNAPTAPQTGGNLVFGSGKCNSKTPVAVNIHYTCDANSNNDQHFFAGLVAMNWNPKVNAKDGLMVEVTIYLQPNDDGNYFQLGSGSLTAPVLWAPATQTWVAVV